MRPGRSVASSSTRALGREDVRDLESGTVTRTFLDDRMPGGPHERTVEYVSPFFRTDREEDYRIAWAFFEHELKDAGAETALGRT